MSEGGSSIACMHTCTPSSARERVVHQYGQEPDLDLELDWSSDRDE